MNLFDLMTRKNEVPDYTQNMPALQPIQVNNDGSMVDNPTIQPERNVTIGDRVRNSVGQKIYDALLGQQAEPTDSVNAQGTDLNATVSDNPRRGGILRDIASGYTENKTTPLSFDNFGQNTLEDGRKKGLAYKLGEGLGSVVRIADSPLGRGLITAGLVGATGGNGLEALAYGGQAGVLNQQTRNADQLYRNALADQGVDTDNLSGYISNDAYKNISQTNTNYQKMLLNKTIADQKDNTNRAQLIIKGLGEGSITPETASLLIKQYGITDAEFQEANATRKANAEIETMLNPRSKVVEMRYSGLPTTKTVNVNNTYEQKGGVGSKYGLPTNNNNAGKGLLQNNNDPLGLWK